MVGQISIFDLMASDIDVWEDFRDNYCKKQGATLKFNEMGKIDRKDGKPHRACCFTPNNINELRKLELFERLDNELPPVTPKQKTGHWIIIDDCERFIAKCSQCGRIEDSRMISKYPYCHCGAKMESEEAEDDQE